MYDLLPSLPDSLTNILGSLSYFAPEVYLVLLFIAVLVTDLLFGKNAEKLCRVIACAGVLLVITKDYRQGDLLLLSGQINGRFLFNQMLLLNRVAIDFKLIIDVIAFLLLLYFDWDDKLKAHSKGLSDLYSITIGALFGLHLMTMAVNLLSIYLAIEMVSIASYLMVAYRSESMFSVEAGLKYVLFGAASSAMMLYGISLLYGFTGSLDLIAGNLLPGLMKVDPAAVSFALVLVLVGIGFKLSFVPMHFWVPDVYEGASTPVTAWLSTLPKIAAFGLLINFLRPFIASADWKAFDFRLILSLIGIASMIAGNFAAVLQNNVKRMLAYSSIGHTGFALMAIVTFSADGITALTFYLVVYAVANIGALALAAYFENVAGAGDVVAYKGLGHKHSAASVCFVIILISLTGLPVTAGFNGKLLTFSAVYNVYQQQHDTWLLLLMVTGALTTVVSLFYYIKIPLNLFLKRSDTDKIYVKGSNSIIVLAIVISVGLILLGLFPGAMISKL